MSLDGLLKKYERWWQLTLHCDKLLLRKSHIHIKLSLSTLLSLSLSVSFFLLFSHMSKNNFSFNIFFRTAKFSSLQCQSLLLYTVCLMCLYLYSILYWKEENNFPLLFDALYYFYYQTLLLALRVYDVFRIKKLFLIKWALFRLSLSILSISLSLSLCYQRMQTEIWEYGLEVCQKFCSLSPRRVRSEKFARVKQTLKNQKMQLF